MNVVGNQLITPAQEMCKDQNLTPETMKALANSCYGTAHVAPNNLC
jgi:hypothetical protein